MKKVFTLIAVLTSLAASAQTEKSKFDFRFGVGSSFLGSGDYRTLMFENEVNYFINGYLSASASVSYGKSNPYRERGAVFLQEGLNIHFSPFKNTGRNDLRIGAGLSHLSTSSHRDGAGRLEGDIWRQEYVFEKTSSLGANLQIENMYSICPHIKVGAKVFTQPYLNGDINSGVLVKAGVSF